MDLQEQIWDWENLRLAYQNASRGKRGKASVAGFEYNQDSPTIFFLPEVPYRPRTAVETKYRLACCRLGNFSGQI